MLHTASVEHPPQTPPEQNGAKGDVQSELVEHVPAEASAAMALPPSEEASAKGVAMAIGRDANRLPPQKNAMSQPPLPHGTDAPPS
jgi:hypothetical protein